MYTVAETAKILNIAEKTLRNKISLGTIPFQRVCGRNIRFSPDDIRAMIKAMQPAPAGHKKQTDTPAKRRSGKRGSNQMMNDIISRACAAVPEVKHDN